MKLKDLKEAPLLDKHGKYVPLSLEMEVTPSQKGLLRDYDHLGRIKFGPKNIYDLWLSKELIDARATTPVDENDKNNTLDVSKQEDVRHQVVVQLRFNSAPPKIPLKNKLQVSGVYTFKEQRGFFIAGALYVVLAKYGYNVISDTIQMAPGKGLWQSIARRAQALSVIVRIWDQVNNDYIKDSSGNIIHYDITNLDDSKIWDDIVTQYREATPLLVLSRD